MTDRPDEPDAEEPIDAELVDPDVTGREAYNVISDTVTGVNVRVSDNVFQAIAILVCLALGAGIGAAAFQERVPAALVGGFIGLVVGLFGSGIWLMCYRAIRHLRGRHD
ncbi:MAG: hypothetical protein EA424_29160 [Planctomycetaceae bacterium]|nr:MAG: hypothetical protein EA424_29160 [Planctomycetaceae bacterium]